MKANPARSYKALIHFMEESRVSYRFYVTLGFKGISLSSLGILMREILFLPRMRSLSSWFVMIWMIFGVTYTLSVPSLVTATSGYTSPSTDRWQMPDGTMATQIFQAIKACWLVQDGYRIGLANDTLVSGPPLIGYMRNNTTCQNAAPDYPLFNDISNCEWLISFPNLWMAN